jgi:hypothetical protein
MHSLKHSHFFLAEPNDRYGVCPPVLKSEILSVCRSANDFSVLFGVFFKLNPV